MELPGYLKAYGRMVRFGGKLGFIPYRYDPRSFEMKLKKSRRYAAIYGINLTLLLIYLLMSTINTLKSMGKDEISVPKKLQFLRDAVVNILLCVQYWSMARGWGVHDKLHKEGIQLLYTLQRRAGHLSSHRKEQRMTLIKLIVMNLVVNLFSRAFKNFTAPKDPTAFSSFFENPAALGLGTKFLLAYFQLYLVGFHFYIVAFTLTTIACYTMTTISVVETLRFEPTTCMTHFKRDVDRTSPSLAEIHKMHIRLAVLDHTFNDLFASFILSIELVNIFGFVLSAFLAAILGLVIGVVRAMFQLALATLFFSYFAKLHDSSEAVMMSWRRFPRAPKWFHKFQKAFERQPLKIRVSALYFVDRSFVLTLLGIMTTNAANLILTFRYE